MQEPLNLLLVLAAILDAIAALLHVGCIVFGAPWYRFFGAGERMVRLADSGSRYPALVSAFIVVVLSLWALYALAGAGVIAHLPLLRAVLILIAAIYLLRGVAGVPVALIRREPFWWWSSGICLAIGLVHLIGLWQVWARI